MRIYKCDVLRKQIILNRMILNIKFLVKKPSFIKDLMRIYKCNALRKQIILNRMILNIKFLVKNLHPILNYQSKSFM
jgi:hypothetical protein